MSDGESVARTTNGGATWAVHHLPDPGSVLACPSPTTCYAAASFTVLKTSDGFGHTQETLARSVIHDFSLNDVSCASATACYADGTHNVCPAAGPCNDVAAPFVATNDGGRTWRVTPTTPDLLARLSCPRPAVCYAIGESNGDSRQVAFEHSGDGARTWQRTAWQQISHQLAPNNQALDISCVAVTTCYLLATITEGLGGNNFIGPQVAVLVTHDDGRTWSVKTGIDAAVRAGAPPPTMFMAPGRISCPSAIVCFVLASDYAHKGVAILSTRNGGTSWTRHIPGAVSSSIIPWLGRELACPTVTTCYLLSYGTTNGAVLVTRDAGATWRRTMIRNGAYLFAITCATAQACRVVGPGGTFATNDGGKTWQRQFVADGTQAGMMTSIACPAVGTCYAVGGVSILATHPGR